MKKNFQIFILFFLVIVTGNIYGQTDIRLNGKWVSDNGVEVKIYDNGNYERWVNGVLRMKGTYTTNNNVIRMTITHQRFSRHDFYVSPDVDDGLFTMEEIFEFFISAWMGVTQRVKSRCEAIDVLNQIFSVSETSYSINGNRLTLSNNGSTWTRSHLSYIPKLQLKQAAQRALSNHRKVWQGFGL